MSFNPAEEWHICICGLLFLAEPSKLAKESHTDHKGGRCKMDRVQQLPGQPTSDELRRNRDERHLRNNVAQSKAETRKENKARQQNKNWDGVRATHVRVSKSGAGSPGLGKRR